MTPVNVIVQAGGLGTRMGSLTRNKPKALAPMHGKPILFHLLEHFPDDPVAVIGDYRVDVLQRYFDAFGRHPDCRIVPTTGTGTCAGVAAAAAQLRPDVPALLVWSDLVFEESPVALFAGLEGPGIGLSQTFPCRWALQGGKLVHAPSTDEGVAGVFWFPSTSDLLSVPPDGEFCVHLAARPGYEPAGVGLGGICAEVGTLDAHVEAAAESFKARPFNRIDERADGTLAKIPLDAQGRELAQTEQEWYRRVASLGLTCVPRVYGYDPLVLERVDGVEPYRAEPSDAAVERIIEQLRRLHAALPAVPADRGSLDAAYLGKTQERLARVEALIPFADQPVVVVNGTPCPNILRHWDELERLLAAGYPDSFRLIHGDPTFSNMLLAGDRVVFIDPRGYFGGTRLFGDPAYDWAKLLYSVQTNYDQFNLGRFDLTIGADAVDLSIASSGWEEHAGAVVAGSGVDERYLTAMLGVIWVSLTTYAWDDYDKVCGAFYKGLEVLAPLWE